MKGKCVGAMPRRYNFDLLRIVACLMVVLLHAAARKWYIAPDSLDWFAANFYDTAVRSCVPLFFMLSGALFLNREKLDLKRFLKKNLATVILVYLVWSALYSFFSTTDYLSNVVVLASVEGWKAFVKGCFANPVHLWYLRALLVVYLFIPILHALLHRQKISVKYLLVVAGVISLPVMNRELIPVLPGFLSDYVASFPAEYLYYVGYVILGYALLSVKTKRVWALLVAFCCVVCVSALANWGYSVAQGEPTQWLYGYLSIPVVVEATLLFVAFNSVRSEFSDKVNGLLKKVSSLTLGVYLCHIAVLDLLQKYLGSLFDCANVIAIPALAICAALVSFAVVAIARRIPVVRKVF